MEPMNNHSAPLVSILIPTHERPKYFSIALASVINQTYPNIEIIVSDNSNDDDTKLIVSDFQKTYKNIKYFHNPGICMDDNWQVCWDNKSPSSKYSNFLMDDDFFAPNKIEIMVKLLENNPHLALATSYRKLLDADGNLMPDQPFNAPIFDATTIVKGEIAGTHILTMHNNWIGEPTTVLFRNSFTDGFFRGWTGEEKYLILDYPLWLRLLEKGDVIYIPEPLSFFRIHGSNDTNDFNTSIRFPLSLAYAIQTAWNKKKYLITDEQKRQSLYLWCNAVIDNISSCYKKDYHGENFEDLKIVFRIFSEQFCKKDLDEALTFKLD